MTRDDECEARPRRRSEPGKRDRTIDVTPDLIAEHGIAGATYRTVAEAAGVPLADRCEPTVRKPFQTLIDSDHERMN